jgi:hypothetical protein
VQAGGRIGLVLKHRAVLLVMYMVMLMLGLRLSLVLMGMRVMLRMLVARRLKDMLSVALLQRTGHLASIIHIVIPCSIVASQRVSDAWVPPEPTALDGRRRLDRENWRR